MTVAEIDRMSKAKLVKLILRDARQRGREWVFGGPAGWSKDELVSYIVRETDLVK
jgi:hypothetical protein